MINIVIVSHGSLGEALIQVAQMIAGPQRQLFSVALLPGESPERFEAKLAAALQGRQSEDTLVLIDLFGGTPCNAAVSRLRQQENVECVTGANLPMLLELLMSRDDGSLAGLAESTARCGQESIKNVGPLLRKRSQ